MQTVSFEPLTPVAFLARSAHVWRERTAVVDGGLRLTYGEWFARAGHDAGILRSSGVAPGDRVAVLAPNTSLLLTAHYSIPMVGGVIVALNHRLSDGEVVQIIRHSGARLLLVDHRFAERGRTLANNAAVEAVIASPTGELPGEAGSGSTLGARTAEDDLLAINYTSGTTGRPKGVMYNHRGAYLQSLAMAYHSQLSATSAMLWTLPMFHCNGWCFTWGVTAAGATHVCLPDVDMERVWGHLRLDGITHFNAAPTVLTMLASAEAAADGPLEQTVRIGTGGAPPSPTLLQRLADLNMEVTHLYGLTETYGPSVICEWQPAWEGRSDSARLVARQGVGNIVSTPVRVIGEGGGDVAADGKSMGEVALRGNNVAIGYFEDVEATEAAAPDGWFRTGDLAVMHPDGYIEIRDRAKDIIISGGENIASVEVEQALVSHPAVLEAAVVAEAHQTWGEVPVAHVVLRPDASVTGEALIEHVRSQLAHFKAPKDVRFESELPKTATGKIQKHVLRG